LDIAKHYQLSSFFNIILEVENSSGELNLDQIKKRAVKSFFSLTFRRLALQALTFVAMNVVLARILPVAVIGVYDIAQAIIVFFSYFSDVGLAASLIQKKEEITSEDIKTTFTIQLLIIGTLSLLIILAAPLFANYYKLDEAGLWLIRVLGLSFFLSSLKSLPQVLLERKLNFSPIVMVEIVESLVFFGLLIFFAVRGDGVWSYVIAAFSRGVVGAILIYVLAPVKLGIGIHKEAAKKLLSFGIPFQLNNLLALLKDRLVPLVIAGMVGPQNFGYVEWSQGYAFFPLDIMSTIIRIAFPTFSRLQGDKPALEKAVEKALFATTMAIFPLILGLCAIMPAVVEFVVTHKWQPALMSFYFFSFSTFLSIISTIFTNTLNAIGRIKTTLQLMVFWTVATWILTPILVYIYGFVGVSLSSFIISLTSVLTIILVKRVLAVRIIDSIYLPLVSSLLMFAVVFVFALLFVRNIPTLIVSIILGGLVYAAILLAFGRKRIMADLKALRNG
jgi:O-antigen/teichoic acid export membrane protein